MGIVIKTRLTNRSTFNIIEMCSNHVIGICFEKMAYFLLIMGYHMRRIAQK